MQIQDIPVAINDQIPNTRYGVISTLGQSDDLITSFLRHYGEWSFLETTHIASYLPKKARVLDIGAYLGTFSLGLAQVSDLSFVAVVEANELAVPCLRTNVAANLQCRSQVVHALIADPKEPLITSGRMTPGNAGSVSYASSSDGTVEVPPPETVLSLVSLIGEFGPFDLVKLDVEGMEEQILGSFKELLANPDTLVWAECNEDHASLSLASLLLKSNRPLTYFSWPSHNPQNFLGQDDQIFPLAHEAGLLLGAPLRELTAQERAAGCTIKAITTVEDVREALWHTPRWAPREWAAIDRFQIAAVGSHALLGHQRESFLRELPNPIVSSRKLQTIAILQRQVQLGEFRIIQLEGALAALADKAQKDQLAALQWQAEQAQQAQQAQQAKGQLAIEDALAKSAAGWEEKIRANREVVRAAMQQIIHARENELANAHDASDAATRELTRMASQLNSVQYSLDAVRHSLTWRLGLRVSKAMATVPLLKKTIRFIIRR